MHVDEYTWVKASEYRENVLLELEPKPRASKKIANVTGDYLSHIRDTLSDFEDHDLAEYITPDRQKGRLWTRTGKGDQMVENLRR